MESHSIQAPGSPPGSRLASPLNPDCLPLLKSAVSLVTLTWRSPRQPLLSTLRSVRKQGVRLVSSPKGAEREDPSPFPRHPQVPAPRAGADWSPLCCCKRLEGCPGPRE